MEVEGEPILSGGGVEFGDDIVEDEPFEAATDDFELALIAGPLGGGITSEEGKLSAVSIRSDLGQVYGSGSDAFDNFQPLGQGRQAQGLTVRSRQVRR